MIKVQDSGLVYLLRELITYSPPLTVFCCQPLTPVVPSPWQSALRQTSISRAPAWHSDHGLYIWSLGCASLSQMYFLERSTFMTQLLLNLCFRGLLEVQVSLVPFNQAFQIQGTYASERSCRSP